MNTFCRRFAQGIVVAGAILLPGTLLAQQAAPPPAGARGEAKAAAEPKAKAAPKASSKAVAAQKADGAKLDAAGAQGEMESGINALAQGRAEAAVGHLSTAISSGSLPAAQSARALYYRGVAYRRHSKPAQAISDLTNSLWIKGGLTDEQRADALLQRSSAYREAGLPDQSAPVSAEAKPARAAGKTAAAGTPAFSAVAPPAPAAQSSGGGFFSSLFGGGSSSAAPPAAAVTTSTVVGRAAAPSTQAGASTPSSETVTGAPKPATRRVPLTPEASNLPMGFQDLPGTVREVEVSTTARAANQSAAPAAKEWGNATEVKPSAGARTPATKPAPQPAAAAGAPEKAAGEKAAGGTVRAKSAGGPVASAAGQAGGSVQVQVAAVRSAQEAQDVASRLQTKFARELGGRAPVVEQTTVGNVGTLFRVQVGPFTSARETETLCSRLKSEGMDCRVVAQ